MSVSVDELQRLVDFVQSVAAHDRSPDAQAARIVSQKLQWMGWTHYNIQRRLLTENRDLKRELERLHIERERKFMH